MKTLFLLTIFIQWAVSFENFHIKEEPSFHRGEPTPIFPYASPRTNVASFPVVSVPIGWDNPVEVSIIASLPYGTGDLLYRMVTPHQAQHPEYLMEYFEGSAKIMNTNFPRQDPTAIYTFSVDKDPLVFHRHEGHRCITGVSGSGGAVMKFSKVDHLEAKANATSFVDKMFIVDVPADSMFVLRFSGKVYHQFGPKNPNLPAFFAVSVHTNELGGELTPELREKVVNGEGNIPLLTEPIPKEVEELLKQPGILDGVEKYILPRLDAPYTAYM